MKNVRTMVCLAGILLESMFALGQVNKVPLNEPDLNRPKLFHQLPLSVQAEPGILHLLVNTDVGKSVSTKLDENSLLYFEGVVSEAVSKQDGRIMSIVIRSTNFPGAYLTLSKILQPGGNVKYTGRIISFNHGDAYELRSIEGKLTWTRRDFYDLVNE